MSSVLGDEPSVFFEPRQARTKVVPIFAVFCAPIANEAAQSVTSEESCVVAVASRTSLSVIRR